MAASQESPTERASLRPPAEPARRIVLVVSGPIVRADIPNLCRRAHTLFDHCDADLVLCDVRDLDPPDAVAVDALARLQLTARRSGCEVRLLDPSYALRELLVLMGLSQVLPACEDSGVEPQRQVEERVEGGAIEEESDARDPTI